MPEKDLVDQVAEGLPTTTPTGQGDPQQQPSKTQAPAPPPTTTPAPPPTTTPTPPQATPAPPQGQGADLVDRVASGEFDQPPAQDQPPEESVLHHFGLNYLAGMGIMSNEQAKNFFRHPINTMIHSFEQQGQLAVAARDAYRRGDYASAVMHGLNYLVPFIGQGTDIAGRQAQKGDIAGAAGTTLGIATNLAMGSPEGRAALGSAAVRGGQLAKAGATAAAKEVPTALGAGAGWMAGRAIGDVTGVGTLLGGYLGRTAGRSIMKSLMNQAGEPSVAAEAALEAPEAMTTAEIQPTLQSGVRNILNDVAREEGVAPTGGDVLLRDAAEDLGDKMWQKSQDKFAPLDAATNNEFTKLQKGIKDIDMKILHEPDASVEYKLLEKRAAMNVRLDEAVEMAKSKNVDPALADQGRAAFKKMSALYDMDMGIKRSMPGELQHSGEFMDQRRFVNEMQKLRDLKPYGTSRLGDALGELNSKRMLQHGYDMQRVVATKPQAPTGPEVTTTAPGKFGPEGYTAPGREGKPIVAPKPLARTTAAVGAAARAPEAEPEAAKEEAPAKEETVQELLGKDETTPAAPAVPAAEAGATIGGDISTIVKNAADKYQVSEDLIHAMIGKESSGVPTAVSPKGAKGLMQLMPETAKDLGLKPGEEFVPEKNIPAGTQYIRSLLDKYHGDERKALAAYNWGPRHIPVEGPMPALPEETQDYVDRIMARVHPGGE